jgi:hypothetical protein
MSQDRPLVNWNVVIGMIGGAVASALAIGGVIYSMGGMSATTNNRITEANTRVDNVQVRIDGIMQDIKERRDVVANDESRYRQEMVAQFSDIHKQLDSINLNIYQMKIIGAHTDASLCYVSKSLDKGGRTGVDCTRYGITP